MFFQELPGFFKSEFYPTNSLPLLSHIPVERKGKSVFVKRVFSEVSASTNRVRHCAVGQSRIRLDN
jgi:hypothetical protein